LQRIIPRAQVEALRYWHAPAVLPTVAGLVNDLVCYRDGTPAQA
jgi:hypothetical protein